MSADRPADFRTFASFGGARETRESLMISNRCTVRAFDFRDFRGRLRKSFYKPLISGDFQTFASFAPTGETATAKVAARLTRGTARVDMGARWIDLGGGRDDLT